MFAVRPICTQDAIFKMSSVSPVLLYNRQLVVLTNELYTLFRLLTAGRKIIVKQDYYQLPNFFADKS